MKILKISLFAGVLFFNLIAQACDFCMLGQGVSPYLIGDKAGVTLQATTIQSNQVFNHKDAVAGNGKKESWTIYSVTGFYSLTPEISLMLTVPYTSKGNVDFDSSDNSNPGQLVSGLGDISLTGRYTLFNQHSEQGTWIGGALFGLKLPTGSTGEKNAHGSAVDRHEEPGTGSYDVNLGFTSAYTGQGYQITLDAVYSLSGMGKWDGENHKYGNTLNANVKGYLKTSSSDIAEHAFYVYAGPSIEVIGKEKGTATISGYDSSLTNNSSGGTVGYLDVGFYGVLQSTTIVNAGIAKAVYHDMNSDPAFGADPAEDYKINLSVSFLF